MMARFVVFALKVCGLNAHSKIAECLYVLGGKNIALFIH